MRNSYNLAILLSLFVVSDSLSQSGTILEKLPDKLKEKKVEFPVVQHLGPVVYFNGKQISGWLVRELVGSVYNWAYCTDETGNWLSDYLAIYTIEDGTLTERIITATSCGVGKSWKEGKACYAGYLMVRETRLTTVVSLSSDGNDLFLSTKVEMLIPYQNKRASFSRQSKVMSGTLNYVVSSSNWGFSGMIADPDGNVIYNEQWLASAVETETKEDCKTKAEEWGSRVKNFGDFYSKAMGALSGLMVGGIIFEATGNPYWAGVGGTAVATGVTAWDTFGWSLISEGVESAISTACIEKLTNEEMQDKLEKSAAETLLYFNNQSSGGDNCVAVTSCSDYSVWSCTSSKNGEECELVESTLCSTSIQCN